LDDVDGLIVAMHLYIGLSCRLKHQLSKVLFSVHQISADLIQLMKQVVSFSALDVTFMTVIVPIGVDKL
jgi:hypothetical protein